MASPLRFAAAMSDVRYALRSLASSPLYAILVIVTLAIGIGPTTAIFSVVHALLIRDLPYRDAESLVVVWRFRNAGDKAPVSGPDFADFRDLNTTLAELTAATYSDSFNLGGVAQPIRVDGSRVTANYFSLLGTRPIAGTLPTGGPIGDAKQVILGHDLWMQSFGGANVIGREARLNGETYVISAVMPRDFGFPEKAQMWIPYDLTPERLNHRALHRLAVIARLKPGVTVAQADADMKRIADRIGALHPDTSRGIGAAVSSLRDQLAGTIRKPLLILLGAVAFLLLIACSNVANLALTRAAMRTREISVRMALGASTSRIARQLFTESLLLSIAGGLAGLGLARVSIVALRSLGSAYFARPERITLDGGVLAFNFAVAVLTGVAFGFAAMTARGELFDALRSGDRTDADGGRQARLLREAIVVAVIAFSFVLLIGAGLMLRSFAKVRDVEVGIRAAGAMTLKVYLPTTKYPEIPVRTAFYERFLRRIADVRGIDAASAVSGLPLENTMSGDVVFPGESDPIAARRIASFTEISPGYLASAGVPLLQGRDFTWDDIHQLPQLERAPVLVNETFARRFGRGALGQQLFIGGDLPGTIIGVVGDVKQTDPRQPTPGHVYLPLGTPLPARSMNFMLRSRTLSTQAMATIATGVLRELDAEVPPYRIRSMEQVVADALAGARFQAVLLGGFAAIALLLATIGIYGVISYTVARRTREVAIRMAVGAAARDVMRLVFVRVLTLATIGLGVGAVGALLLTRVMEAVLFEVEPADPKTFAIIAAVTLATALLASALPARRAAGLDPMRALRAE
jgi:putative ABC transport system permease protein